MKLIITTILAMAIFCSCNQRPTNIQNVEPAGSDYPSSIVGTVTIDGCEYLKEKDRYYYIYVHKGNCKNPIHKCKCSTTNESI